MRIEVEVEVRTRAMGEEHVAYESLMLLLICIFGSTQCQRFATLPSNRSCQWHVLLLFSTCGPGEQWVAVMSGHGNSG